VCRAVFEIPTATATAVVVPAATAVVEQGRGGRKGKGKGKQTATTAILPTASSLPVNLFASSMFVNATSSSSAAKVNPNEIKCEICEDGEDATSFCVQCAQYLCAGCERAHKRLKGTTFHEVFSVDKALKGKMKNSVVHCEKHPQQEINTYCHTDKLAICSECSVDFHRVHEIERLINVVQGFREEISQPVDKVLFFFFFLSKSVHPLMAGVETI